MASPASDWPLGSPPTPERSNSATTEPLYRVRPVMTAASGLIDASNTRLNENRPKAATIMTSTGTERKNSTMTVLIQRIAALSDSRPMPKSNPKAPARTTEIAAALRVLTKPGMR